MSKKLSLKIVCCICSAFLTGANVGAFRWFSKSEEENAETAKSSYDNSVEILEESKADCSCLFEDLNSILSELENVRTDFKSSLEKLEESFKKLNEAYSAWGALGYPIKGEEYAAYNLAKEEYQKISAAYRLKREMFKSCCQRVECLFGKDSKILDEYEKKTNNSINLYYNYGIALAKNNSTKS